MRDGSKMLTLALVAGLAAGVSTAAAQDLDMAPPASHEVEVGLDSGAVAPGAAAGPQVLWSGTVSVPDARWLRLAFGDVVLPGDSGREDSTVIRLTSMEDGAVQVLTAEALSRWSGTSAYFNGDAVFVELIGSAGSGFGAGESLAARVVVRSVTAGDPTFGVRSICGPTDDRVLSNEPRSARFMPSGCSSWLINDVNRQFLTAGHCGVDASGVCEFNVPLSNSSPERRYPTYALVRETTPVAGTVAPLPTVMSR